MLTLPLKSFPLKEIEALQIRLNSTLAWIFGIIALNLIEGSDAPYIIDERQIDLNGVSRPKTLRILEAAEALPMSKRKQRTNTYSSYTTCYDYESLFNKYAKDYETPIVFPEIPYEIDSFINDESLGFGFTTTTNSLRSIGYIKLSEIHSGDRIYMYYHPELYEAIEVSGDCYSRGSSMSKYYYPKELLESRKKAVIKAIMKKYCEEDILAYIQDTFKMDLTGQSQSLENHDVDFSLKLRSFHRYPVSFSDYCFSTAPKSYTKEIEDVSTRINFEFNRLKDFKQKIDTAGGCKELLNGYINNAVDNLVAKSVTLMAGDEEDIAALNYILDHRDLISYDYLYNK